MNGTLTLLIVSILLINVLEFVELKLKKNLEFVRLVNSIKKENHCYNSNLDNKKLENNTWNFPKVSPKDGNLIGSVADQLNLNFHSSFACFTIVADPTHDEFAKGRNVLFYML